MGSIAFLLTLICIAAPTAWADQKKSVQEKDKTQSQLSKEEREILKDRELLENLELLQNFDKIKYIDFLSDKKAVKGKDNRHAKQPAKNDENKNQ